MDPHPGHSKLFGSVARGQPGIPQHRYQQFLALSTTTPRNTMARAMIVTDHLRAQQQTWLLPSDSAEQSLTRNRPDLLFLTEQDPHHVGQVACWPQGHMRPKPKAKKPPAVVNMRCDPPSPLSLLHRTASLLLASVFARMLRHVAASHQPLAPACCSRRAAPEKDLTLSPQPCVIGKCVLQ